MNRRNDDEEAYFSKEGEENGKQNSYKERY